VTGGAEHAEVGSGDAAGRATDAAPGELRAEKQALRREMRARVAAIAPWSRAREATRAAHVALLAPPFAHARTVLAYQALPDEIEASPLVAGLVARGVRVAFPHVDARGRLLLLVPPADRGVPGRLPSDADGWTRDRYGIAALDPCAPGVGRIAPDELDAVIVPGRAFDPSGARLGRGKGYYDALLARLRPHARAATMGIAFDAQLVGKVPAEPHDRRVAWIATARGVRRARRAVA
jgi:5-formyltetrahydrofolate cyclo-ligase